MPHLPRATCLLPPNAQIASGKIYIVIDIVETLPPSFLRYYDRVGGLYIPNENLEPWTLDEISCLQIPDIMEHQSNLSVSDEESTTADFPEEDDMPARRPDADEDWDEEVQELKKMLAERKRDRDNYYRRTILVRNLLRSNDGDQNLSYYSKIFKNLKECSLERLMLECEKFFVLENGNVRFTYSTRREAICWLIEARSTAQQLKYRWTQLGRPNIQIEMMVPPDSVGLKYKIQNYGRRLKLQRVVQSYQAVETRESGEWKIQLRLYLRGYGTFTIKSGDLGDNFDEVLEKARTMINSLQGMGVDRLFQTEE